MSQNPKDQKPNPLNNLSNQKLYFMYAVLSAAIFFILIVVGVIAWNSGIIPK
ncbi:MAG: hypothetical protein KA715_01135 [Xanthomonadaceae bacterium]|nr:hypothetical protein [Xanthomonadaceae bacterium]